MSKVVETVSAMATERNKNEQFDDHIFLSDPGIPGPIYGSECLYLGEVCADLTDVTLPDEY